MRGHGGRVGRKAARLDVHGVHAGPFPCTSCWWLSHPARTNSPLSRPDGATLPPAWTGGGGLAAQQVRDGPPRDPVTQAVRTSPAFKGRSPPHQWETIKEAQVDKAKVFVPGSPPQRVGAVPTVGSAWLHGGRVEQVSRRSPLRPSHCPSSRHVS